MVKVYGYSDDLVEIENSTYKDAEIEVRKEAMQRLADRTKGVIRPIVDKQN